MKFKIGDRVRILPCPNEFMDAMYAGKDSVITAGPFAESSTGTIGPFYQLEISGLLEWHGQRLEPLVPPDELAWQQFKTYLQPNPSILPPIVTTSDEEAARIAETTPGSHIHVVSRSGYLLSEYWGSQW